MSSDSTGSEILDRYRTISSKLKRRFLRKPNVTEACESFSALGKHCESSELPAYAGMCWISAARCEGSLGNTSGESTCLIRAARQFITAEEKDYNLGCPSPSQENLEAALGCYAYASSRFPEDCPIPIGLNLEIVEFLSKVNRKEDTEGHLQHALELCGDNLDTKLYCLEKLAHHYIEMRNYSDALSSFNEVATILDKLPINGARSETLLKCEINRVLLLLILRPSPQKLSPNLAKLLEKYTWGDQNDTTLKSCGMSEHMFILLQSLVAVCQSLDTSNLDHLESELWKLLETEERDLLRILRQPEEKRFSQFWHYFLQFLYLIPIAITFHYCKSVIMTNLLDFQYNGPATLEVIDASESPCKRLFYDVVSLRKELNDIKEQLNEIHAWKIDFAEEMEAKTTQALDVFYSDQVGMFDYASEYAGGSIMSTPNTYPYHSKLDGFRFFGTFDWMLESQPNLLLLPSLPGKCFAFYGDKGRILIKLGRPVVVTHVSLEHLRTGQNLNSAPRDFQVLGYDDDSMGESLGSFVYELSERTIQTFKVYPKNQTFKSVELRILSNHGNELLTCIYRFRVHSNH